MTRFPKNSLLAGLAVLSLAIGVHGQSVQGLGNLPLFFAGQSGRDGQPQFLASGPGSQVLISPASLELHLRNQSTLRAQLVGASPLASLQGSAELTGKLNYLTGNRPGAWRTSLPMFGRVGVENLYPGVSAVYYGNQQRLEYDFTVAPGTSPAVIQLRFSGADKITINASGELALTVGPDEVRQPKPVIYQTVNGARREVTGGYRLLDDRTVAFAVGHYDPTVPLVIDPILYYSSYLDGTTKGAGTAAWAVAVNTNDGSVFVAGQTTSPTLSTTNNVFQKTFAGGAAVGDAFVAKFDAYFNLVYLTYLGGSGNDAALALAVNSTGNAFIGGYTDSPNFPVTNHLAGMSGSGYQYNGVLGISNQISGALLEGSKTYPLDGFVAELAPDGASLVYSTYLGGNGADEILALTVDQANNAYVTGFTTSTNLPAKYAIPYRLASQPGGATNLYLSYLACPYTYFTCNAFIAKISNLGTNLDFLSYFGGDNFDVGTGIAVDGASNVYVTGYTASTNFPNLNAFQTNLNQSPIPTALFDGFVAKLGCTPTNYTLLYSTFLGSTNNDQARAIAVDNTGAYVTGFSTSTTFYNTATNLLPNYLTNNINGYYYTSNLFLTKIITTNAQNASSIAWSTLFGGSLLDTGNGVAVDPNGNVFVVGTSCSANFPTTNAFGLLQSVNPGDNGVTLTAFSPGATNVLYSVLLGGTLNDYGNGIAVDQHGTAFVTGWTYSPNFPLTTAASNLPFISAQNKAPVGATAAYLAAVGLNTPVSLPLTIYPDKTNHVSLTWPANYQFGSSISNFVLEATTNLLTPWLPVTNQAAVTTNLYLLALPDTNQADFFRLVNTNNPN